MTLFIQLATGVSTAIAVSFVFILQSSFGEARHALSIIGAIAIFIASLYVLRSRFTRWGNRGRWLKYHRTFATFGLCLVLIHSGAKPQAWHSWLIFVVALLNLGTGLALSMRHIQNHRFLRRCHLVLAPTLLAAILLHSSEKLDHDAFLPLNEEHDIPCVKCHSSEPLVFSMDLPLETKMNPAGRLSDDIQWEFQLRGIAVSQHSFLSMKKFEDEWLITDVKNERNYIVRKAVEKLKVYADSTYKTYTCRTCHVHNTPELQFAHEVHGVDTYSRCLDCHQTVLNGKTYGNQRANWEFDTNW